MFESSIRWFDHCTRIFRRRKTEVERAVILETMKMLSDLLQSDDEVFSEESFSDEDLSDCDLEIDLEADALLESVQNTESGATVSESQVVLDAKLWEGIPADLLDKILARLPPAAHFRFRCVSKRWANLASSPGWLQHYAQNESRPSSTLMCRRGDLKAKFYCYSELKWFDVPLIPCCGEIRDDVSDGLLIPCCGEIRDDVSDDLQYDVRDYVIDELDDRKWRLVDVDAGFMCCQRGGRDDTRFWVFNPLTQSSRVVLPNYPRCDPQPPDCEFLKLVVDRQTQTFKIVVLLHSTLVYDSTTDSWTEHESFPSEGFRVGSSFLWKDVLYLQCFSMGKLLAFDVNSGVWSDIDSRMPWRTMWRHFVINHNDNILLIQTYTHFLIGSVSVWKLVTDPSKPVDFSTARWVKMSINTPPHLHSLLNNVCTCFSQTDRICFTTTTSNQWITYSFATRSWDIMPTRGQSNASYDYFNWDPRLDVKFTELES